MADIFSEQWWGVMYHTFQELVSISNVPTAGPSNLQLQKLIYMHQTHVQDEISTFFVLGN